MPGVGKGCGRQRLLWDSQKQIGVRQVARETFGEKVDRGLVDPAERWKDDGAGGKMVAGVGAPD